MSILGNKSKTLTPKAQMDVDELVDYVTSGMTASHTLEVISSESEDALPEQDCDSDAIDVGVIEADMDLEELMKQKELLQAEIARATDDPGIKNGKGAKMDEVILLDDSSNDADVSAVKKKRKRSKSRERRIVIDHRRIDIKKRRSISRERHEMDRRKNHEMYRRSRERKSPERRSYPARDLLRRSRDRSRRSRSRDANRRPRESSRDRYRRLYDDRERERDRDRYHDRREHDRKLHMHRQKSTKGEKLDKYKDSLSEGLKQGVSSDSDELDIDINDDEEDEQAIIEKQRKQREELLKRLGGVSEDSNTATSLLTPPKDTEEKVVEELSKKDATPVDDNRNDAEESLTPPLLPNMKPQEDEKKDVKPKANQWDMFAEQDIFKHDTSVSNFSSIKYSKSKLKLFVHKMQVLALLALIIISFSSFLVS